MYAVDAVLDNDDTVVVDQSLVASYLVEYAVGSGGGAWCTRDCGSCRCSRRGSRRRGSRRGGLFYVNSFVLDSSCFDLLLSWAALSLLL